MQDQMSLIFLDRLKPKTNNVRSLTVKYEGLHQLNTDWVVPLLYMVLLFVVSPHRQQSLSILRENFQQTNSTFKQTKTHRPPKILSYTPSLLWVAWQSLTPLGSAPSVAWVFPMLRVSIISPANCGHHIGWCAPVQLCSTDPYFINNEPKTEGLMLATFMKRPKRLRQKMEGLI